MTFWQSVAKQNVLFSVTQLCPSLYDLMDAACQDSLISPRVFPSSCPLHWWCQPAISSSDALFSFCPQFFPTSGTLPMSQLFASDDQNTRASASALVVPMSVQGWFPLRLTCLISLLSRGHSGVFSSTTVQRHQFFRALPSSRSSSYNCMWPLRLYYTVNITKVDILEIIWSF